MQDTGAVAVCSSRGANHTAHLPGGSGLGELIEPLPALHDIRSGALPAEHTELLSDQPVNLSLLNPESRERQWKMSYIQSSTDSLKCRSAHPMQADIGRLISRGNGQGGHRLLLDWRHL